MAGRKSLIFPDQCHHNDRFSFGWKCLFGVVAPPVVNSWKFTSCCFLVGILVVKSDNVDGFTYSFLLLGYRCWVTLQYEIPSILRYLDPTSRESSGNSDHLDWVVGISCWPSYADMKTWSWYRKYLYCCKSGLLQVGKLTRAWHPP